MADAERLSDRRKVTSRVADRLWRYLELGDASPVLEQAARDDAVTLHLMVGPATSERAADIGVHALVGYLYWCRYHATEGAQDRTDLAIALAVYSVLLELQPDAVPEPIVEDAQERLSRVGDPSRPGGRAAEVNDLAVEMLGGYSGSRAPDQLDAALDMFRLALEAAAPGDIVRAQILSNLGSALMRRYEHSCDAADLEGAVAAARAAVAEAIIEPSACIGNLATLAVALRVLFEHSGHSADAEAAVATSAAAVALTPAGDPERPRRLSNLAGALQRRFELRGDRADLDAAVRAARDSVGTVDATGPERVERMTNLAVSLYSQFRLDGNGAVLDEAIDLFRDVVTRTGARHPAFLTNLSDALRSRYELHRDPNDLAASISAGRVAGDVDR